MENILDLAKYLVWHGILPSNPSQEKNTDPVSNVGVESMAHGGGKYVGTGGLSTCIAGHLWNLFVTKLVPSTPRYP